MATLKDLKPGDHVLMSHDVSIHDIYYTTYCDKVVSDITDSGLIVVAHMKFDPNSGLECECPLHRRRHIVMPDDKQALNMTEEYRKAKKIFDVLNNMHSCRSWNLSYEQAICIAMIMGWKV